MGDVAVGVPTPLLITRGTVPAAVHQLEAGAGPIVVVVPGTGADALTDTTAEVVRELDARRTSRPASVGVIQYRSTVGNIVERFTHLKRDGDDVLLATLRQLASDHADQPVYLLSESQGSWMVADVLRAHPDALQGVTRGVVFSTPGFAKLPVGEGATKDDPLRHVLRIEHTDDIVPGLFAHLNGARLKGTATQLAHIVTGKGNEYPPHHYVADAAAAATFLNTGRAPDAPIHPSSLHADPIAPEPIPAEPIAPDA